MSGKIFQVGNVSIQNLVSEKIFQLGKVINIKNSHLSDLSSYSLTDMGTSQTVPCRSVSNTVRLIGKAMIVSNMLWCGVPGVSFFRDISQQVFGFCFYM